MKFKLILLSSLLITACHFNKEQLKTAPSNTLTKQELNDGWQLLFDGNNTGLWRGYKRNSFPSNWQIVNGTLYMKGGKNMTTAEKADRSDIIYPKKFENFSFKLDWKISKNGNSGIFYLGQEVKDSHAENNYIWRTAPEMQILDNDGHPDADKGHNGNRQAGSLYDLVPAQPQNARPVGEWNQIEITVNNRFVTHKQNGVIVVSYQMDTEQWRNMIAQSKFPQLNPLWHKVAKTGLIGLQDHDDEVWFRNIKIKEL